MSITSLKAHDLRYIFFRNLLLLTNGVIFSVVILLFVFGNVRAGIFLGIIAVTNISFGLIQDIRAWNALHKLQLLTAPRVTRINKDGKEESVLAETIQKGDTIKLKNGDQVPCDSTLMNAFSLEINEGLITGESNSITRKTGDHILAGSLVTSGSGTINIDMAYYESRIARMTGGIKKYIINASPIQKSVDVISKYSGYILIITIIFIIVRGILNHGAKANIVLQIGTMSSMIVPQGIAFMVTIFLAYGAANLFKKHVLLQEVNATEKLGRIRNLCMDKTGTITENILSVKDILTIESSWKENALALSTAYIEATNDSSQTIEAIKRFLRKNFSTKQKNDSPNVLPFSSWRQYGAARVQNTENINGNVTVFAGPPQIFLPHIKNEEERNWLNSVILASADTGERILCFMKSEEETALDNLAENKLSVVGVFVFYNVLREGIHDTINFFQNRGVVIRIISGDNPETTRAVAAAAGINNSEKIVTSEEMKTWNEADFEEKVKSYVIFAGVLPEQKKQIVQAFKKEGFTAMIGDGANDALAIKNADLGIAMWDGAPAVRKIASIVLTNNSFAALPGGVKLADNIIRYIEMFASMFLNQTIIGIFLFIIVSIFNYDYPLTPFNITLINYFTIGIPGILILYWVIWPRSFVHKLDTQQFLKKVLPFATISAIFQAIGIALSFAFFVGYLKIAEPNTIVALAFIILGFSFFLFLPKVYQGAVDRAQILQIIGIGIFESLILIVLFQVPLVTLFFNVSGANLSNNNVIWLLTILTPFYIVQYFVARYFASRGKK